MEVSEELIKWVNSLSMGEKRFIRLLGTARARAPESQRLDLLDWLEGTAIGASIPVNASFSKNLPLVSDRLKDLILDGLHLLHKNSSVDAQLRNALDETALLFDKGLFEAATRTLKRAKKLAAATSRYAIGIQLLEFERKIAVSKRPSTLALQLNEIRAEEQGLMTQLASLQELHGLHELARIHEREIARARNTELTKQVADLASRPIVAQSLQSGQYLERALGTNILGIHELFQRQTSEALSLYKTILEEWEFQPKWQVDQLPLLLSICNHFQFSCQHIIGVKDKLVNSSPHC